MFTRSVRRFATTAYRAAETLSQIESSNPYGIQVAKAQGHVNGFVGGVSLLKLCIKIYADQRISAGSNWKYSAHTDESTL